MIFLLGFFIGMNMPLFAVYLSEIQPTQNRGRRFVPMNYFFTAG